MGAPPGVPDDGEPTNNSPLGAKASVRGVLTVAKRRMQKSFGKPIDASLTTFGVVSAHHNSAADNDTRIEKTNIANKLSVVYQKAMSDSEDSERDKKRQKRDANAVDMQNAARKVWLVKVPEFVKEAWAQQPGSAPLGTMTVLNPLDAEHPEVSTVRRASFELVGFGVFGVCMCVFCCAVFCAELSLRNQRSL